MEKFMNIMYQLYHFKLYIILYIYVELLPPPPVAPLQVGWVQDGPVFLLVPVCEWQKSLGLHRHVCEIQVSSFC